MRVQFVDGTEQDIVVDSGAEESVCPVEFGQKLYGMEESKRMFKFRGAGGNVIKHHGQRTLNVAPF